MLEQERKVREQSNWSIKKGDKRSRRVEYTVCQECEEGDCWDCRAIREGVMVSKEKGRDLGPVCGCRCFGYKGVDYRKGQNNES